jgi:hypothetical protein
MHASLICSWISWRLWPGFGGAVDLELLVTPRAVSSGHIEHLSASQLTNWSLCNRRWWFEKVARMPVPSSPAKDLGTSIHKQMERYYLEGEVPEHFSAALLVKSGLIPPRVSEEVLIEHPEDYQLGISVARIPFHGRIDLIQLDQAFEKYGLVNLWDWKSKTDFSYALTSEDLERDVQMMLYGKYAFEQLLAQSVRFHHGNIKTKVGSYGYKVVSSQPLCYDDINRYVDNVVEPLVHQIKVTATAEKYEEVKPNWGACYAYNKACPFLDTCGMHQSASVHLEALFQGDGMGLKESLSGTTSSSLPGVTGVTTATVSEAEGLTLYINALPVKGVGNLQFLDDIIAEASREILEGIAKETRKPAPVDLRMIQYGEGKGRLAAGLRQNPPRGTVVATSGELSDVAIEALLPLARVVVRGTR